ncbi:hypothetical protein BGZ93_006284 [Podila epicladia]|nr:hypothetical protein BGZ92_007421 [Podila epicladia]KAG0095128.1 hypothetical protein BGZ93_006284 [Podila epicladia]
MVRVEILKSNMQFKNLALIACVASVAFAQVNSALCQIRYTANIATCLLGVKECNPIENFSNCVCANTGNAPEISKCLAAMLSDPLFASVKAK